MYTLLLMSKSQNIKLEWWVATNDIETEKQERPREDDDNKKRSFIIGNGRRCWFEN